VRCKADSEAFIQTYLFDGTLADYHVGDSVIVDFDELDEFDLHHFYPLHPRKDSVPNGQTVLVIVVGVWKCDGCGLYWQWAKLSLRDNDLVIQSLETFVPTTPSAFDGVHWVQLDLAEQSGLFGGKPPYDYQKGAAAWAAHSVEQRIELMVAGYRTWCSKIAQIDMDSI
jgi:hypothetical protein